MSRTLGFIGGQNAYVGVDGRFTHVTTGRVLEEFARYYTKILWCTGTSDKRANQDDYPVPANVEIIRIPAYSSTIQAMKQIAAIKRGYHTLFLKHPDHLFIRGFVPGVGKIYDCCLRSSIQPIHWLVGNPIALLQSHRRKNRFVDVAGIKFSEWWERTVFAGIDSTGGTLLCNGRELYERCAGHSRCEVVSSVIRQEDIIVRSPTPKTTEPLNITTVCYVRPEKGIEFLIEAAGMLRDQDHFRLNIVGSRSNYPAYQVRLDTLIQELQLSDCVTFLGHATREEVLTHIRKADIFVFSSLSEGTPHALVEAMANGAPIVTTNVGGIPTMLKDGTNALMVQPKAPALMADALHRLASNPQLRMTLAANGYERAAELTVDRFVEKAMAIYLCNR